MNQPRRSFLKGLLATSGAMALGTTVLPATVMADLPDRALESKPADLKIPEEITDDDIIKIKTPDIAENGQVVPVEVTTNLEKVESITIIAEKNPIPLVCEFNFPEPEKTVGWVKTRIKMARSSNVIAVVKADGKLYRASREVKVTIGGCGG